MKCTAHSNTGHIQQATQLQHRDEPTGNKTHLTQFATN